MAWLFPEILSTLALSWATPASVAYAEFEKFVVSDNLNTSYIKVGPVSMCEFLEKKIVIGEFQQVS